MTCESIDTIVDAVSEASLPPVHLWNPPVTRTIDMRIARNGDWFYQGSQIQRLRMVKLFSTVLRVDNQQTYLVTPQERLAIDVEDAHFTAVLVERHDDGESVSLVFTLNTEELVIADEDHPVFVSYEQADGEPSPYVIVRNALKARICRAVYYQLAEWAEERNGVLGVVSKGSFMVLSDVAVNQ